MIKLNDITHLLEGNFEFYISPSIFNPHTITPSRKVSFEWNPEISQDLKAVDNMRVELLSEKLTQDLKAIDNMWAELLSEKLKQDFKKALLEDLFEVDLSYKIKNNT